MPVLRECLPVILVRVEKTWKLSKGVLSPPELPMSEKFEKSMKGMTRLALAAPMLAGKPRVRK